MTLTDRFLVLATPAGRPFAFENSQADCRLGSARVLWSGDDRVEFRYRILALGALELPGPLGELSAGPLARYGILDSRTGGPSSAFAVPAFASAVWSAVAWTLGHSTTDPAAHSREAGDRGVRPAQ